MLVYIFNQNFCILLINEFDLDGIYSIPVFTQDFCKKLIEELKYFEASPMPKGRPNTMNNYGVEIYFFNVFYQSNILDSFR